jgi:hypothetical protein
MSRLHRVAAALSRSRKGAMLIQALAALTLGVVVALPAQAVSCDALRASVEAKIRRHGVSDFSLSVVDANQVPSGKVVGTCELGTKKLVYVAGPQRANTAAAGAQRPRPMTSAKTGAEPMIVECFDGKVYTEGPCKK